MKQLVPLLECRNLYKHYSAGRGFGRGKREQIRAVDGVSFQLMEGETLGLVGESGCGKSTLARLLVRLENPGGGRIIFAGEDITAWQGEKLRRWRRNAQIIFQDAFASLNPRLPVEEIIIDPLKNYDQPGKKDLRRRVDGLLELVGLDPAVRLRYPHEFSGGQRQRIAIARALVLEPRLIICDECVANLDVSIQAQILNLIKYLKEKLGLALLFISHDLAAVKYISDRVAVMYLGNIVEVLESGTLVEQAVHPYTRLLLSAVPLPDPAKKNIGLALLQGEPPNPANPPPGCCFHPRCPQARDKCSREAPAIKEISKNHWVVCHL